MKIIHIAESFAGGVYDFISDLTKGMPNEDHVVIHGLRSNTPDNFLKDFPPHTRFILWEDASREISPIQDIKALISLIKILKSHNDASIVHLHSSKAGFLGRIAARFLGIQHKVIYTPHGVSFLRKDVSALKHKIFVWLEKTGSWFGGQTVACSKSEMEAFHQYRLPATYINNGIECKNSSTTQSTDKKKLCIGTIGRISAQKNPILFNSIAKSFQDDTTVEFLWIGDGELKEKLTSPNINTTGWITREEVDKYLENIDIYLSTSLWEGLPLSVLQAMCAHKPLLLSNCVGNKDLVKNGYNGKIFHNENEGIEFLTDLLANKILLKEYGLHSYTFLKENFTLQKMLNHYKNIYHQTITE
jgi:glycosyltransferase involved in cell wall biosynthesis